MSLTQPLKWHGGKHYLAKKIIALFPPHLHYVEPYAGGLSVLLEKDPEGVSEVVNDLNSKLTNFWIVLQRAELFSQFQRQIEAVPFSEMEWGKEERPDSSIAPAVSQAIKFFIRCRQSRAGAFKEFATLTRNRTRRGMSEQASAWLNAIEGLPAVHARLKRVVILNRPALDVIRQQDGENTLYYIDAPYIHSTRTTTDSYAHEMSDDDHEELIETLLSCKGKCVVSMYHHPIYDILSEQHHWNLHEFTIDNKTSGGSTKRKMTECIWLNY